MKWNARLGPTRKLQNESNFIAIKDFMMKGRESWGLLCCDFLILLRFNENIKKITGRLKSKDLPQSNKIRVKFRISDEKKKLSISSFCSQGFFKDITIISEFVRGLKKVRHCKNQISNA